jgi:hypothetical protein
VDNARQKLRRRYRRVWIVLDKLILKATLFARSRPVRLYRRKGVVGGLILVPCELSELLFEGVEQVVVFGFVVTVGFSLLVLLIS